MQSLLRNWENHISHLLLATLVIAGSGLRFWHLGHLNFWGDEDITALAVQGVLEHGYPRFPSGMIYFRSMPFTYLSALAATIFGLSEWALRLPSILFSLGTIVAVYALGKRMFSAKVGLSAALILTLSYWDLEFARHGRMYATFAFFYVAALYGMYRSIIEGERKWLFPAIAIGAGVVVVHELGITLALVYLAIAARPQAHMTNTATLLAVAAFLILLGAGSYFGVQYGFQIPGRLLAESAGDSAADSGRELWLNFQCFPIMSDFVPQLYWLVLIGAGIVFFGFLYKNRRGTEPLLWAVLIGAACIMLLHQAALAILALSFGILYSGSGYAIMKKTETRFAVGMVLVLFVTWTAYGMLSWNTGNGTLNSIERLREVLKLQAGVPRLFFIGFLYTFPLMAVAVAASLLWFFHTCIRSKGGTKEFFLLSGFMVPLLATGFIKTDWVEYRLNFHLNSLFVLIFVVAFWRAKAEVASRLATSGVGKGLQSVAGLALVVLFVAACEQIHPHKIEAVLVRDYGSPVDSRSAPGSHYLLMPDHAMPGMHVRENRTEDDIVVAIDWLEQRYYAGQVDYWLRSDSFESQTYVRGGRRYDIYTNAQVLATADELRDMIAEHGDRRIWIIADSPNTEARLHIDAGTLAYLESLKSHLVFRGRDGKTLVYLVRR